MSLVPKTVGILEKIIRARYIMENYGIKVRTVIHESSWGKCCSGMCHWRIFSRQMGSGGQGVARIIYTDVDIHIIHNFQAHLDFEASPMG